MSTRICPACGAQYLGWVTRCADCGIALVDWMNSGRKPGAGSITPLVLCNGTISR